MRSEENDRNRILFPDLSGGLYTLKRTIERNVVQDKAWWGAFLLKLLGLAPGSRRL